MKKYLFCQLVSFCQRVFLVLSFYGISWFALILSCGRIVTFIGKRNIDVNANSSSLLHVFYKFGFSCMACFLARFVSVIMRKMSGQVSMYLITLLLFPVNISW